jgi:pyrimidine operon attenuation protein/uracil phosphoribosyltransferase
MKVKSKILDEQAIQRTITRLSHEILEKNKGAENIALVGIQTRGEFLAKRIRNKILEIEGIEVPTGILNITLYRDDVRIKLKQPEVKATNILFDINDKDIILIDDVLYTGRTVRAAMDALTDLGRYSSIQLLVLIDRGHRELPIKADYVGKNVPTSINEEIRVKLKEVDGEDAVYLVEVENNRSE